MIIKSEYYIKKLIKYHIFAMKTLQICNTIIKSEYDIKKINQTSMNLCYNFVIRYSESSNFAMKTLQICTMIIKSEYYIKKINQILDYQFML